MAGATGFPAARRQVSGSWNGQGHPLVPETTRRVRNEHYYYIIIRINVRITLLNETEIIWKVPNRNHFMYKFNFVPVYDYAFLIHSNFFYY